MIVKFKIASLNSCLENFYLLKTVFLGGTKIFFSIVINRKQCAIKTSFAESCVFVLLLILTAV